MQRFLNAHPRVANFMSFEKRKDVTATHVPETVFCVRWKGLKAKVQHNSLVSGLFSFEKSVA